MEKVIEIKFIEEKQTQAVGGRPISSHIPINKHESNSQTDRWEFIFVRFLFIFSFQIILTITSVPFAFQACMDAHFKP